MSSRLDTPSTDPTGNPVKQYLSKAADNCRALLPTSLQDAAGVLTFATVVAVVVVAGYLQGAVSITVALPAVLGAGTVVILQAVMACFTVSGLFGLSTAALFGQVRAADDTTLQSTGATVTAIVPVHEDAAILDRSVESLLNSQYENVQVLIVAEPTDETSIARARELAHDARVDLLINTRYPGSKAGAINYAAEVTDTEYIAVFDADERVDPGFVSAAVAKLQDYDIVQGRTIPEPDGLIETIAYYESVVLGDLSQRLLTLVTDFTMAASRTIVMRRSAFEEVGGYDESMLTEDYAFAFDCYGADLDVAELLTHTSTIEAAHTLGDWWGQRKRWMTGYAQVLHRLVVNPLSPRSYRSVLAPVICAGSVLGNLFMLSLVSKALVLVVNDASSWLALPLATLGATALAMRAFDVHLGRLDTVDAGWILTPLILPLYSLVGIKAAVEYLFTWDGEWYSVAKGS